MPGGRGNRLWHFTLAVLVLASAAFAQHVNPSAHIPRYSAAGYNEGSVPARDCIRSPQCAGATFGQEKKKERNHEKLCAEAMAELDRQPGPGTNIKLASCYR
jgi:hypothetical protein